MITADEPNQNRQTAEQEWQLERRSYIGSSEVFELLNAPQYGRGCATALGYRKLNAAPDFPIEEDDALLRRGNILEPIAASIYEDLTMRKVRRPPMDASGHAVTRRHPRYQWAAAATDRLVLAGYGGVDQVGDLEIKTRDQGAYFKVLRTGPYFGDMLQPQWSMFVTGHQWAGLAMLGVFGTLPMITFDRQRDEELMTIFEREGDRFAETVWGLGTVPTPAFPATDQRCKVCVYRQTCRGQEIDEDELHELRVMKKASRQLVQITNPQLANTLQDIDLLKKEKEGLQTALDAAHAQAVTFLEDVHVKAALVRGYGKVYRMSSASHYFDSQALRKAEPELYERFLMPRETSTYLRTYPYKEERHGNR